MTLAALLSLIGCGAVGVGAQERISGPTCSECSIELREVLTMGDVDGPGAIGSIFTSVTRDRRGRYYVFSGGWPYANVFDADGTAITKIGQPGSGPGEYRSLSGVIPGPHDSLFVFDVRQRRMTVYDPDYELARTASLPASTLGNGHFIGDEMLYEGLRTNRSLGYPLHRLTRTGEVINSFGSTTRGMYRADMREIINQREVADAESGHVWVARLNQYLLEKWSLEGELVEAYERDASWFPTWWRSESDETEPPVPFFHGLERDGDTLWTLVLIPGDDWSSAVIPWEPRYNVTDRDGYRHSMIEAVDLNTMEVIASVKVPRFIEGFVGPGVAYDLDMTDIGVPVLRIFELTLSTGEAEDARGSSSYSPRR